MDSQSDLQSDSQSDSQRTHNGLTKDSHRIHTKIIEKALVLLGCPRKRLFLHWFCKVVREKCCFYIGFARLSAKKAVFTLVLLGCPRTAGKPLVLLRCPRVVREKCLKTRCFSMLFVQKLSADNRRQPARFRHSRMQVASEQP